MLQLVILLALHNGVRETQLEVRQDLMKAAQEQADHMAKIGKMRHSTDSKLRSLGYRRYGENVAAGYKTPDTVFRAWMKSRGHRRNIKNEKFKYIGIGRSGNYWCVIFAGD